KHVQVLVHPETGHEDEAHAEAVFLDARAALNLTVIDAGRPATEIAVVLRSVAPEREYFASETAPQGTCSLQVPAGRAFTISLHRPETAEMRAQIEPAMKDLGFYSGPSPVGFDKLEHVLPDTLVLAPGETRSLQVELPPRTRLRGVVRDQHARPVAGLRL